MAETTTATRVVRFCLDTKGLEPGQQVLLERHAGTARAAWNWALGLRNAQHDELMAHVRAQAIIETAGDADAAKVLMAGKVWRTAAFKAAPEHLRKMLSAYTLGVMFTAETRVPSSRLGWWSTEHHGVNRFAVSSALQALDVAFGRFYKDTGGHRSGTRRPRKDGRPAAWPRFKKKGRAQDSFAIFKLVVKGQDPWRVVSGGHRVEVPSIGSLRVHENTKRLRRLVSRGGRATSARFTRSGGRWYVAINVEMPLDAIRPAVTTRAQRAGGTVGVDLGVKTLATLSTGDVVANVRWGRTAQRRIARIQRKLARQQGPARDARPSAAWVATKTQLSRAQHDIAVRRQSTLHDLTKQLATRFAHVAIEDLNVRGMTGAPAAVPDPARPGAFLANGAAAKGGLNRAILDVGFGEFRRQLQYKTKWYGSTTIAVARFAPTSKMCSTCGAVKAKLSLSERTYRCDVCGLVIDRDLNAAHNIRALALTTMASQSTSSPADVGDTKRLDKGLQAGALASGLVPQDPGPPRSQEPAMGSSPPARAA